MSQSNTKKGMSLIVSRVNIDSIARPLINGIVKAHLGGAREGGLHSTHAAQIEHPKDKETGMTEPVQWHQSVEG